MDNGELRRQRNGCPGMADHHLGVYHAGAPHFKAFHGAHATLAGIAIYIVGNIPWGSRIGVTIFIARHIIITDIVPPTGCAPHCPGGGATFPGIRIHTMAMSARVRDAVLSDCIHNTSLLAHYIQYGIVFHASGQFAVGCPTVSNECPVALLFYTDVTRVHWY